MDEAHGPRSRRHEPLQRAEAPKRTIERDQLQQQLVQYAMRFSSHESVYTGEIEYLLGNLGFFVALVVSYEYTKMVYTCKSIHFSSSSSFQCSKLCEEATRFRFLKGILCLKCTVKRNARRAMPMMQILETTSFTKSRSRSALISAIRDTLFQPLKLQLRTPQSLWQLSGCVPDNWAGVRREHRLDSRSTVTTGLHC